MAYATQLCVLLSFAGITWGVMSTSWDEEIEGSFLGAEPFGRNLNLMRGGEDQRREEAKLEFAEVRAGVGGTRACGGERTGWAEHLARREPRAPARLPADLTSSVLALRRTPPKTASS